jgi:hypothetical protein
MTIPKSGPCTCPCSCWSYGQQDDDCTGLIVCDACRMNIHSGDRPRPRPVAVPGSDSAPEDPHQEQRAEWRDAITAHHKRQRRERWRRTPPPIKPGMNRRQPHERTP